MRVLHVLAVLSALFFGLQSYSTTGAAIAGWVGGVLMPYGVALAWAVLVVPPGFTGASIGRLSRHVSGSRPTTDETAGGPGIALNAFRDEHVVRYWPASEKWAVEAGGEDRGRLASAGWADLRRVGFWPRRVCFVGLFVDADRVWLHVDGHAFDLSAGRTVLSRRTPFPFVKRFEVRHDGQSVFGCRYFWADLNEWPDDEDVDIFLHAVGVANVPEQRERFAWFWAQRRRGVRQEEVVPFERRT